LQEIFEILGFIHHTSIDMSTKPVNLSHSQTP